MHMLITAVKLRPYTQPKPWRADIQWTLQTRKVIGPLHPLFSKGCISSHPWCIHKILSSATKGTKDTNINLLIFLGMATGGYTLVVVVLVLIGLGARVEGQWCVAKTGIPDSQLQTALDWACANGADCGPIQAGGPCSSPDTLQSHCSYAFNSYYQKQSKAADSCDFQGAATVTSNNPSYEGCVYPSSTSTAGTISLTEVTTQPKSGNSRSGQTLPPSGNPSITPGISSSASDGSGSKLSSTNLS